LPWRCPVYRWRELIAGAGMEQENLCLECGGWLRVGQVSKGDPHAESLAGGRVPMPGTGADRLVVAMKAL